MEKPLVVKSEITINAPVPVVWDTLTNPAKTKGEKRYKDTYNNGEGRDPILMQIKNLAEES